MEQSWWQRWIEKTHPVRAILAIGSLGITAYLMITDIPIPDAWWVIVTGLCLFYVEAFKSGGG